MGGGWEPSDVETHFGPTTIPSKKRECDQQNKCIQVSMKNNAEELVIKESLYDQTQKRIQEEEYLCLHMQLPATFWRFFSISIHLPDTYQRNYSIFQKVTYTLL